MSQKAERQQAAEAPIVNAWSTNSTVPFFRVGNYAPVSDELTTFGPPVEGAIPLELNGWYLRNGPNPRHGRETPHWFTGDGMILPHELTRVSSLDGTAYPGPFFSPSEYVFWRRSPACFGLSLRKLSNSL